jgi:hypothetical protein
MESMTGVDSAKIEPSDALAQLMRQDREREPDAPIGGWRGEWAVQQDEPPPVPPRPFVIPSPDWQAEQVERDRLKAAEAQEKLEPAADPYPARRAVEKPPRWP